jgi:uncharacterized membrane protein YsdA (DUF1294 family)
VGRGSKGTLIVRWLVITLGGALVIAIALLAAGLGALLAWLVGATVATFVAYAVDKRLAKGARRRAPEAALLLMSAAGGCAGGLLAMFQLRHKTRHTGFWVVNVAGTIGWLAIALFLAL